MKENNTIQLTRSQLDRFARIVAVETAKKIIGDYDDTDLTSFCMTQKDAADYIGVDVSTIRSMQRKGQLHGRYVGNRLKYCKEELNAFRK